jgi:hypothetical protein
MIVFESESQLLAEIDRHDEFVRQCGKGNISFDEFCEVCNNFYLYCALDGHESDEEEQKLLAKHEARILPHQLIADDILGNVCSAEDASKTIFKEAGRFGPQEAVTKLKEIADSHLTSLK